MESSPTACTSLTLGTELWACWGLSSDRNSIIMDNNKICPNGWIEAKFDYHIGVYSKKSTHTLPSFVWRTLRQRLAKMMINSTLVFSIGHRSSFIINAQMEWSIYGQVDSNQINEEKETNRNQQSSRDIQLTRIWWGLHAGSARKDWQLFSVVKLWNWGVSGDAQKGANYDSLLPMGFDIKTSKPLATRLHHIKQKQNRNRSEWLNVHSNSRLHIVCFFFCAW